MSDKDFADCLMTLLTSDPDVAETFDHEIRRVRTYDEVGMLTRDAGLVVELEDGTEFQITIVSR